ncbi:MAG: hypothetical protein MUE90_03975 [Thermoanaerobaculales bacterium]|nr:hypothetical protein [Thermoanaerobaculales bacterium]
MLRISGGLLLAALLAAGYALYLSGRDARASLDAVSALADGLRDEQAAGAPLDRATAEAMAAAMETLRAAPETIADHVEELRAIAHTAAAWAAAAPTASPELHAAVCLRTAAGHLRAYALGPSPQHLLQAERSLAEARLALSGGGAGASGSAGLATDGLRDRLGDLEQAAREQRQELDEALAR